jgi:hypothetical protein
MRTFSFMALVAASLWSLPNVATPQSPVVQDGVKLGKVYVTGENPVIRLLDKEGGATLTNVSYWRIIWSPAGAGHVCYVTTGEGKSAEDLRLAFVDNRKLYDFLTEQIMAVIDASISARPFTFVQATFNDPGQGVFSGEKMIERKLTIRSEKHNMTLTWRDFYEPFQLDTPVGSGQNPFGVASLFIPAKGAEVLINGKKAPGNVYPQQRGPVQSSTAFLAFSESWVR